MKKAGEWNEATAYFSIILELFLNIVYFSTISASKSLFLLFSRFDIIVQANKRS